MVQRHMAVESASTLGPTRATLSILGLGAFSSHPRPALFVLESVKLEHLATCHQTAFGISHTLSGRLLKL